MRRTSAARRPSTILATSAVVVALLASVMSLPASAGAPPSITSFSPPSGPIGSSVTINGTGFLGASSLKFNGTAAGFSVNGSGTQIIATVPSGATTGPITVTGPDGTGTSGSNFTVTPPVPIITGFNPTSGAVGTSVSINGSGFTGTSAVRFNGTGAAFTVNGAGTKITTTVPAGATTGKVSVQTPGGTAQSADNFTVLGSQAPVISAFSPTFGPVGTTVTLTGAHFSGVTSVKLHGDAVPFVFVSDSQVVVTIPPGATSGKITLTTPAGKATSATSFSVVTMTVPIISGFTPHNGGVGT
ncbi:MAG: IPT/TIG domain-containing protein, partial [Actinomycetota bacterium]